MKKLLGLLAFMLATVSFAETSQDVVKNFYFDQDFRVKYNDQYGDKANHIGNAGFKKKNIEGVKSRTEVGTTLGLNDEGGLNANLLYKHEVFGEFENGKKNHYLQSTDLVDGNLSKDIKWGNLDTTTKLGVRHWTNKDGKKHTKTNGESNELYFGPTFGMNVLGQNIKTTLEAVYFGQKQSGNQDNRYYRSGNDGAKNGWGANLSLGTDGKLLDGNFGTISYDVSLDHYLRDASGKNNKSNVRLDYTVGVAYDTPSFGGFYAFVRPENEWSKHTATDGYENEFTVWTGFGYKKGFETSVGTITVNPSVRYSPVNKLTDKGEYWNGSEKKNTVENNELRAGVKVSLDVK